MLIFWQYEFVSQLYVHCSNNGNVLILDPESSTQQTLEICGMADVIFKPSPPVAKVSGGQTAAPGIVK